MGRVRSQETEPDPLHVHMANCAASPAILALNMCHPSQMNSTQILYLFLILFFIDFFIYIELKRIWILLSLKQLKKSMKIILL